MGAPPRGRARACLHRRPHGAPMSAVALCCLLIAAVQACGAQGGGVAAREEAAPTPPKVGDNDGAPPSSPPPAASLLPAGPPHVLGFFQVGPFGGTLGAPLLQAPPGAAGSAAPGADAGPAAAPPTCPQAPPSAAALETAAAAGRLPRPPPGVACPLQLLHSAIGPDSAGGASAVAGSDASSKDKACVSFTIVNGYPVRAAGAVGVGIRRRGLFGCGLPQAGATSACGPGAAVTGCMW
jgi:hypothetical protein